jgi:hypothetical protein
MCIVYVKKVWGTILEFILLWIWFKNKKKMKINQILKLDHY